MASALLALSKPIYAGFKSETDFIKNNPNIVGKRGSMKRLTSIPYGFKAFGEGFIKAGGGEAMGRQIAKKKHGGMNCETPMLSEAGAFRRSTPALRSAMGGGHILAGMAGSGLVLGHLPAVALIREHHRAHGDRARPIMG